MENSSAWMEVIDTSDMEKLEGEAAESLVYTSEFSSGATARMRLDRQGSVAAMIEDPYQQYSGRNPYTLHATVEEFETDIETRDLSKYTSPGEKEDLDELMNEVWQEAVSYR
jgi:hypothetical protein